MTDVSTAPPTNTFRRPDTDLYYDDAGVGPALLFLHGLGTNGRVWGAQQAHFVDDHRVVTLDWRGCGRSGRPLDGNDYDGVVDDLVALTTGIGLDRPVVVGSSMGAVFATELALARPDLVAGAVCVDGPAHWGAQVVDLPSVCENLRTERARFVQQWVPGWFAEGVASSLIDWTVLNIIDATPFLDRQLAALDGYDPRPRLGGAQVPIHYIHGELDSQVPVAVADECASLSATSTVRVVPGAGHMPHQERPEQFNAALRALLPSMAKPSARGD